MGLIVNVPQSTACQCGKRIPPSCDREGAANIAGYSAQPYDANPHAGGWD
jgi:hypothetical protein